MFFSTATRRFWGWWGVVFFANAALMTIELVTARILAPYLGASLTSWTSIIAIVMVSMAIGSAVGASLVRRQTRFDAMIGMILLAAAASMLLPSIAMYVGPMVVIRGWPVGISSFVLAIATLTVPSAALACLYPFVVQRVRSETEAVGMVIGRLGAAAALGSIIGVILSGFVWMMWFSLPAIIYMLAIGLLLIAWTIHRLLRAPVSLVEVAHVPPSSPPQIHWKWKMGAALLGAGLMSVEIVASRVIAPFLGVSVYTWTGIISVMLIGVSIGNVLGGMFADQLRAKRSVGVLFLWTAWSIIFSVVASALLGPVLAVLTLPLLVRILLLTTLAFLAPALMFGIVSPMLVVAAADAKHPLGEVAGILSAWNTLGGLLGSVGSGFILIAWIGTRWLLVGCALAMVFVAIIVRAEVSRRLLRFQLIAASIAGLILVFLPATCLTETRYFCIRIQNEAAVSQGETKQALQLDHLVHSFVDVNHPDRISSYSYEWIYAHALAYKVTTSTPFSSYFIGGGGFVFPRYISTLYPYATSSVSEIDPGVVDFNYRELGLKQSPRLEVYAEDARQHLVRATPGAYDFVFGDAFNDLSVPYHLTTEEFHQLVKRHMKPDGIYAMNTIDDVQHGAFLAAMIRTLEAVWEHVYVLPGDMGLDQGRNTIVLLATDSPLDLERWRATVSPAANVHELATSTYRQMVEPLSPEQVQGFLRDQNTPKLTDAFAPTDRYLAPLFREAY